MGWTMPMPPASDTAATSSGLLQGYMAPQISGTSMPASRVSAVSRRVIIRQQATGSRPQARTSWSVAGCRLPVPLLVKPPHRRHPTDQVSRGIGDIGGDEVLDRLRHIRNRD